MNIGTKLARVQALNAVLFFLASIVAIGAVYILSQTATQLYVRDLTRLTTVQEMADTLAETRIAQSYLIFSNSAENRALSARRTSDFRNGLQELREQMRGSPRAGEVTDLVSAWSAYAAEQAKLIAFVDAGQTRAATQAFEGPLEAGFQAVDNMTDEFIARISDDAAKAADGARVLSGLAMASTVFFGGLGIILALTMLRVVQGQIVRPLERVTKSLSQLAAGDVDVVVEGSKRRDEIGAMVRALEVFRGQAKQLEEAHRGTLRAQADAEALARHDVLTGLPNRRLFIEAVTRAVEMDGEPPFAVLLIDLDRFKPINDAHGHDAGDLVLRALADRFRERRGEYGMLARLGGDEFVMLLPNVGDHAEISRAAEDICAIVSEPIALGDIFVDVGATIGIAVFPQDGRRPSDLLRAADLAMYQAKTDERGTCRFFTPTMQDEVERRAFFDADLKRGISEGEIEPFYQPLVSIESGELVGFEILSRWRHPKRGLVMPDDFIPAADERGLLTDLTYRLLRQACKDAKNWPARLKLSINLAPSQLTDPLLAPRMLAILTEGGMAPGRIEVEVTENALVGDLEATKAVLTSLRNLGMTVALDDFGTGYSSLYHLKEMKFDKIKVDRSFVMALGANEENEKIIKAMISLGRSLGLTTTAEGIEDAEQWSRLSSWGCDFGQGYLFGKALPADQALALANETKSELGGGAPARLAAGG